MAKNLKKRLEYLLGNNQTICMKPKIGRPRMGKKLRKVLSGSVAAETYNYVMREVPKQPVGCRTPGRVLDVIVSKLSQ